MKRIFYFLCCFLATTFFYGQKHKFQTLTFSTLSKGKNDKWGKWTEAKPTKIIITADEEKHRFVVYSERIQLFEVLKYEEPKTNEKETTNAYICKDELGQDCTLTIITQNKSKAKQFYIAYEDFIIEYDIIYLGDK